MAVATTVAALVSFCVWIMSRIVTTNAVCSALCIGMKRMRKHVTWYLKAAGRRFDSHEVYSLETAEGLGGLLERALFAKD